MRTKLYRIATIIATTTLAFLFYNYNDSSALEYSNNADVSFTINPSITVSLSSSDLIIDELSPGTSSDSNSIVVNVSTNNVNGYHLSSTVGSLSNASTSLVHNINSSNIFSSLSTSDNLESLNTPGTWGYSYSNDSGVTWSAYSGLPLYTTTGTTLSEKYTPSNDNIGFKIAAYATGVQAAGEYNNTINFTATAYPNPMTLSDSYAYFNKQQTEGYYTMQDMEPGICATATDLSTMQVIDLRDHNTYTIAKLADHRCWMTTNLNLEGGTEIESTLSDVPENYTLPVANGFQEGNRLPESSTTGFSDNSTAYLFNSNRNDPSYCSEAPGCYSYYSWTTATAGSGVNITTSNTDAPYSICPKNWKLPTSRRTEPFDDAVAARSNYYNLAINYGVPTGAWYRTTSNFYNYAGPDTVPNFILNGYYYYGLLYRGGYSGDYQTATSIDSTHAYSLSFYADKIYLGPSSVRGVGTAIRCLANNI